MPDVNEITGISTNGTPQSRTHGLTHELLTAASQSVTHDVKGNTTLIPVALRPSGSTQLKLKWDFDNRLSAADTNNDSVDDVFYRFDALGRRVARDDGTAHTIFFQDGQQTIADYPAGTAGASPTYTYVYASYIDEPVMRGGSGGLRYYHRNQQYSIVALTDGGGSIAERYAYSAYGQVAFANAAGTPQTSSASHNRYTYTGREWNAGLKLYHYRARLYDPIGGRFVTRDPIGYSGGINTYQYQSALSSLDPKGTFSIAITPALPVLGVVDSDGAIIVDGVIACRRRNKPDGPDPCKGVCEAYLRASLAQNQPTFGGEVLCLGRHKCPCVFAYPLLGIMPKQCPALDAIIMRHEVKHLRDVTCNFPENTITRPPYANPTNATAIECRHRQASIGELSTFIETEASPFCKSKMSEIKDELESWVSLNCMGDQPFDPFS